MATFQKEGGDQHQKSIQSFEFLRGVRIFNFKGLLGLKTIASKPHLVNLAQSIHARKTNPAILVNQT